MRPSNSMLFSHCQWLSRIPSPNPDNPSQNSHVPSHQHHKRHLFLGSRFQSQRTHLWAGLALLSFPPLGLGNLGLFLRSGIIFISQVREKESRKFGKSVWMLTQIATGLTLWCFVVIMSVKNRNWSSWSSCYERECKQNVHVGAFWLFFWSFFTFLIKLEISLLGMLVTKTNTRKCTFLYANEVEELFYPVLLISVSCHFYLDASLCASPYSFSGDWNSAFLVSLVSNILESVDMDLSIFHLGLYNVV